MTLGCKECYQHIMLGDPECILWSVVLALVVAVAAIDAIIGTSVRTIVNVRGIMGFPRRLRYEEPFLLPSSCHDQSRALLCRVISRSSMKASRFAGGQRAR